MRDKLESSYHFSMKMPPAGDSPAVSVEPLSGIVARSDVQERQQSALFWLWLAFAFGACVVSAIAHMSIGLDNDTMMLSHQAKLLLAGAKPYVDYVDVDPPLSHLLFVPPVLLAKLLWMPVYKALNLMTIALIALSLFLSESPQAASWSWRVSANNVWQN